MKAVHFALSGAALLIAVIAVPAAAEGPIGTVVQGRYVCELPGDAGGLRGIEQEELGFRIRNASRYTSPTGSGTYLRRGDQLVFTSGPRNGERYQIISDGFLRKMEEGKPSRLRCVRNER